VTASGNDPSSFASESLADAGAAVDDVLARERQDVDVARVEVVSPAGDRSMTLPPPYRPTA
jgi:hypothetical protein